MDIILFIGEVLYSLMRIAPETYIAVETVKFYPHFTNKQKEAYVTNITAMLEKNGYVLSPGMVIYFLYVRYFYYN
jgi:hypothetical protein